MNVATSDNTREAEIGASLFAPVPAQRLYAAVLDVRNFPAWAPGVRRVEVLANGGRRGMTSEWEVSFLGLRREVFSVLEEADEPGFLRWTYEGPVTGWGECSIRDEGYGAIADFWTFLRPTDPFLGGLFRSAPVRDAVRGHLKRSLARLGRLAAGEDARVLVGPPSETGRRDAGRSTPQNSAQVSSVASNQPVENLR